jgi:hypothetical protein
LFVSLIDACPAGRLFLEESADRRLGRLSASDSFPRGKKKKSAKVSSGRDCPDFRHEDPVSGWQPTAFAG